MTVVASDYVIIAGTPQPRDASCLPYYAWRTQITTGGDCRTAEQNRIGATTQQTRIQWKLGVMHILRCD